MNCTKNTLSWYSTFEKPEAHITSKKSRLKVYDSKNIYLKDESPFEIELHNPTQTKYMAKLWINGKSVSSAGLVINPGERVFLERFIDENAKFVFRTFEVDSVDETAAAREKNGLVRVEFYPEVYKVNTSTITTVTPPVFYDTYTYKGPGGNIVGYSTTSLYSSMSFTTPKKSLLNEIKPDQVETGRVEKGEKSKQEFKSSTGEFYKTPYYTYEVHLLPESLKMVEAGEIRNYCSECGTRIKKTGWKFCPTCGEKL